MKETELEANARLRKLLKEIEFQGRDPERKDYGFFCLFCGVHYVSKKTKHANDCEAFTPTGEVR